MGDVASAIDLGRRELVGEPQDCEPVFSITARPLKEWEDVPDSVLVGLATQNRQEEDLTRDRLARKSSARVVPVQLGSIPST